MTKQTAGSDTRILGSLRSTDGQGIVRIEDVYRTDIDDLWTAITDPQRLIRWYGEVDGDLRPGGTYRVHLEGPGLYGVGRVEACDAPRHLRVATTETDETWRPGDDVPAFDESIEATLTGEDDRTRLVLEARGMPIEKIAFYGVGWQLHAEHLADYLAGRASAEEPVRWDELLPDYQRLATDLS